jgi:hypothetical protein
LDVFKRLNVKTACFDVGISWFNLFFSHEITGRADSFSNAWHLKWIPITQRHSSNDALPTHRYGTSLRSGGLLTKILEWSGYIESMTRRRINLRRRLYPRTVWCPVRIVSRGQGAQIRKSKILRETLILIRWLRTWIVETVRVFKCS